MLHPRHNTHHRDIVRRTGWGCSLIGEFLLTLIALFCTLVDIIFRSLAFLIRQGIRLFSTLVFALALASFFIVGYLILTGITLIVWPGFHTILS